MRRTSLQTHGFSLIELAVVLALTMVGIAAVVPDMELYLQRQQLRQAAKSLGTYVDKAKTLAITTECKSSVRFTRKGAQIDVQIALKPDPRWHGCQRWFEQTGNPGKQELVVRQEEIASVELLSDVTVVYQGLSGKVDGVVTPLQLRVKKMTARLLPDGVGQEALVYDN